MIILPFDDQLQPQSMKGSAGVFDDSIASEAGCATTDLVINKGAPRLCKWADAASSVVSPRSEDCESTVHVWPINAIKEAEGTCSRSVATQIASVFANVHGTQTHIDEPCRARHANCRNTVIRLMPDGSIITSCNCKARDKRRAK